MEENNIISNWLDQNGNQEIDRFVEKNLAITEKVRMAMEQKGWKNLDLANAMDKTPSEVSKWLSGLHNLTLKSIVKLEEALNICLIHTEPIKQYEYVYLGVIKTQDEFHEKSEKYKEYYSNQEFEIAM